MKHETLRLSRSPGRGARSGEGDYGHPESFFRILTPYPYQKKRHAVIVVAPAS